MAWAKLNDVFIDVLQEEQVNFSNDVTTNPVEDSTYITDNIQGKPIEFSINGIIRDKVNIDKMRVYVNARKAVRYVGINNFGNAAILSYSETYNSEVSNGVTFNMSLRILKVAKKVAVEISLANLKLPDFAKIKTTESDAPARALQRIKTNAGRQAQVSTNLDLKAKAKGAYK